jgi:hypothetical protein
MASSQKMKNHIDTLTDSTGVVVREHNNKSNLSLKAYIDWLGQCNPTPMAHLMHNTIDLVFLEAPFSRDVLDDVMTLMPSF